MKESEKELVREQRLKIRESLGERQWDENVNVKGQGRLDCRYRRRRKKNARHREYGDFESKHG